MNLEINIIITHVCPLLSSVNSINHSNSSVRFCIMEFIYTIGHKLIICKTVPSATAEEIQGLTSYPENFLFRGHRKCSDSVHLSVV